MKKSATIIFVFFLLVIIEFQFSEILLGRDYYRTFEIIGISENSLILQDYDGNIIEVDKDSGDYKIGYKVRYDSVRNRLRGYRWQDYTVSAITENSITIQHISGDTLELKGDYTKAFKVGDQVRYDSVGDKLQLEDESNVWRQYTVMEEERDRIKLKSNRGQDITLYLDNNLYKAPRGLYLPKYKVGDKVRYNATTNKLRKGIIRTYDWQEYKVTEVTEKYLVLINKDKQELSLENKYGDKYRVGDQVKYDRLNDLLKKAR
ncbi:MAG: hypothetical protein ACWGOD_03545 [Desulfobulbales bacterium]